MFWAGAAEVVDGAIVGWVEDELVSKIVMKTQESDKNLYQIIQTLNLICFIYLRRVLMIWTYDMTLMYVHLYYHFKALNEKHQT